jgi:erythromycin esterase-like protein
MIAAAVCELLDRRPRLLALGEPTHLEEVLLEVRNEVFRHLVEEAGYRTITIESDCLMGLIVDDYVIAGTGTLDEVMERGFSHGWGVLAANRELVRWMRAYNEGRPAAERVHFAGFDGPLEMTGVASPREALEGLHRYVASDVDVETLDRLLGADGRWTDPGTLMDPSRSVGRSAEANELRLLAGEMTALLDAQTPHLIGSTSRAGWERARLYARTATGLLLYHYWLADTSPQRLNRLVAQRDTIMAANLLATAATGPTFAHAHNSHLQRGRSSMQLGDHHLEWWSAGAIVNAHLGADYAFVATAVGTIEHHGVSVPPADTVEGYLYGISDSVIDPGTLPGHLVPRVSPYYGYAPLDPAELSAVDGLVFVKDLPPPSS